MPTEVGSVTITAADTATDTTDTSTDATAVDTTEDSTDWKAEADKWKAQARKHEDRAKANGTAAKELEDLKTASMSDQEKAVNIARAEARTAALAEFGTKLVDAEVRAAAAGRPADVIDALLEGLDRARFLDADGEPDRDAIAAWVERVAPASTDDASFPDLGQGTRGGQDNTALNGDPLFQALKKKVGAR